MDDIFAQPLWLFATAWALHVYTTILQLDLNGRMQSFAGSYSISAYLEVVQHFLLLMRFIPHVMGRYDTRGGLRSMDVVEMGLAVWGGVQAWRWKRVEQTEIEEGDE